MYLDILYCTWADAANHISAIEGGEQWTKILRLKEEETYKKILDLRGARPCWSSCLRHCRYIHISDK
jgi:hypothetical protein